MRMYQTRARSALTQYVSQHVSRMQQVRYPFASTLTGSISMLPPARRLRMRELCADTSPARHESPLKDTVRRRNGVGKYNVCSTVACCTLSLASGPLRNRLLTFGNSDLQTRTSQWYDALKIFCRAACSLQCCRCPDVLSRLRSTSMILLSPFCYNP